jgi:hypothetical protein
VRFSILPQVGLIGVIANNPTRLAKANFGDVTLTLIFSREKSIPLSNCHSIDHVLQTFNCDNVSLNYKKIDNIPDDNKKIKMSLKFFNKTKIL